MLGMTGAAISSLLLGFSSDFTSALLARFLCGLFSGMERQKKKEKYRGKKRKGEGKQKKNNSYINEMI
jgi:hypothetical protein